MTPRSSPGQAPVGADIDTDVGAALPGVLPSRRRVVGAAAVGAGVLLTASGSARAEPAAPLGRFGVTIAGSRDGGLGMARELDLATELGLGWVRFGVDTESVLRSWGDAENPVEMDEKGLEVLARDVSDARKRGLQVCLLLVDARTGDDVDESVFLRRMREYWDAIARAVGDQSYVWQVFNEPDGWDPRSTEPLDGEATADYLAFLARALGDAQAALHRHAPHGRVTTNLYGYPVDDARERRWREIFDVIAPSLDVLTVDAYPDLDAAALDALPARAKRLADRYGASMMIGEIGLPTGDDRFDEADQADAYARYVKVLDDPALLASFFYELRSTDGSGFGILQEDGSPKPAFTVLRRAASQKD